jgi:hypothetical protein
VKRREKKKEYRAEKERKRKLARDERRGNFYFIFIVNCMLLMS